MFWSLFVKERPAGAIESALEGIVFKEGKGRFFKRFWKKRLLAYDEVAKCLRYYTPQRVLKGTIFLYDILYITPGRSSGKDVRKDSVFEITIPGRVYVFHVTSIRETKKWIGIVSRELDALKIRDRIQLKDGNLVEATYSKTLRANSVLLNSLRIGDHREHEECCFLFDEEQQHKVIALESLCSLQAMKIYELSHAVETVQNKCDEMSVPSNEEISWLKQENQKLRKSYMREQIRVLDLKATIEEAEEKKTKEQTEQGFKKAEKHQHLSGLQVHTGVIKTVNPKANNNPNTTTNAKGPPKLLSQASKTNLLNASFTNLPTTANSRMEEIKRLTEELAHTKALLAQERARALESPTVFDPRNNGSSSSSSSSGSAHGSGSGTITTTFTSTTRSPAIGSRNPPSRLGSIPESTTFHKSANSYHTFSPSFSSDNNHHPSSSQSYQLSPVQSPSSDTRPKLSVRTPPSPLAIHNDSTQIPSQPTPAPPTPSPSDELNSTNHKSRTDSNTSQEFNNSALQASFSDFDMIRSMNGKTTSSTSTVSSASTTPTSSTTPLSQSLSVATPPSPPALIPSPSTSVSSPTSANAPVNPFLTVSSSPSLTASSPIAANTPVSPFLTVSSRSRSHSVDNAPPTIQNLRVVDNSASPGVQSLNARMITKSAEDPAIIRARVRTNSNPAPVKYKLANSTPSLSPSSSSTIESSNIRSKFGSQLAELLHGKEPDDNVLTAQFIAKLNEVLAEVTSLTSLLDVEREKVKILRDEKEYIIGTMEDMKEENNKNKKLRNEMEDIMHMTEGKLNAMEETLEREIQQRIAAEAQLERMIQAQSSLQQSILEDQMPSPLPLDKGEEASQPLLMSFD